MNVRYTVVPALLLALASGPVAFADTRQLVASTGLDPVEAANYGTVEIVALKINAEARRDDRYLVVIPDASSDLAARAQLAAEAGVSLSEAQGMSLTELAIAKNEREARGQDRVGMVGLTGDTDGGAGRAQIIASIHLDSEAADVMTLHEITLAKYVRESDEN